MLKYLALAVMLAFPIAAYHLVSSIPNHPLDWWVGNTPKCWGPFCINVYYDRIEFLVKVATQ